MKQYDTGYNVDIYSDSFDGWVYPNGTVFVTQSDDDFAAAKRVYGGDDGSFRVPDLRHFVKLNPGLTIDDSMKFTRYQNALLAHTHDIKGLSCSGSLKFNSINVSLGDANGPNGSHTICGWGVASAYIGKIQTHATGQLTNARFEGSETQYTDESLDVESKPVHNIMPVMVFIGRQLG